MPEPMTPADCDLRDFPHMQLDVLRLRDSDLAAEATGDEFRAAVLLWCAAWHQIPAASLPNDDKVIAHLAGYGRAPKEWKKVRDGALRGFVLCDDGRLYHPHVAAKANEAWAGKERFAEKREQDRKRLKEWRDKKRSENDDETRFTNTSETSANSDETRGEGEGEGRRIILPVSNDTGAAVDSDKAFWDAAKGFLGARNASLIGKWVRDHGREATAAAISAAQVERAVNPIEFIQGRFRKEAASGQPVVPL